jgi:hypothetical protein
LSDSNQNSATKSPPQQPEYEYLAEEKSTPMGDTKITVVDTQTLAIVTPNESEPTVLKTAKEEILLDTEESTNQILEKDLDRNEMEDLPSKDTQPIAKNPEVKKALENKISTEEIATTEDDISEIRVRGDELLSSRQYVVPGIEPDFSSSERRLDEVSTKTTAKQKIQQADKGITDPNVKIRNIEVEFWKSIVNFKGYQYDGSKVKLYGIDQTKALNFKELDDRLYVSIEDNNYYLEKNTKYNRLVLVTNPTLLKVLNE